MPESPPSQTVPVGAPVAGASLADQPVSPASAADVGPSDPVAADPAGFRRILLLVGVGFFIQTLATDSGGIPSLPLKLYMKNALHLPPATVAAFGVMTGIAWYCKPIAGIFADTFRLGGTRYRSYLLLATGAAALVSLTLAFLPHTYSVLLGGFVLLNVFLMLISTVLGGFMVMEGQRFEATGRLGAFRNSALYATSLIAGPLSGWLAARDLGWTMGVNVGMLVILAGFFLTMLHEPPEPERHPTDHATGWETIREKLKTQYAPLWHAKTYWAAVGMTLFITCMPGFGTPFLYYQTDTLHLSDQFIGNLGIIQGGMAIVGGLLYAVLCRRITLRAMLYLSTLVSVGATLLYLLYDRGVPAIISIETVANLLLTLPSIALMDLAARATPKGGESMAYAFLMAVYNLGVQSGTWLGAWLHDKYHLNIKQLIVISAVTTLLTLVAIPFLPHALVGTADGEAVEKAGDVTGEETPDV